MIPLFTIVYLSIGVSLLLLSFFQNWEEELAAFRHDLTDAIGVSLVVIVFWPILLVSFWRSRR